MTVTKVVGAYRNESYNVLEDASVTSGFNDIDKAIDFDPNTYAYHDGVSDTIVSATWDLGELKKVSVFFWRVGIWLVGSGGYSMTIRLKISQDNSTWETIFEFSTSQLNNEDITENYTIKTRKVRYVKIESDSTGVSANYCFARIREVFIG